MSMNIQIYMLKRNFDVQKAERFFKERRVPYQLVDLSRHRLGSREIDLFASKCGGAKELMDLTNPRVKEHPAVYCGDEGRMREYLAREPFLLRLPIVRNDRQITFGADEKTWARWLGEAK